MPCCSLRWHLLALLGVSLSACAASSGPAQAPTAAPAPAAQNGQPARVAKLDWPQWRGPKRDGISTETGLLKEWPKEGPPLLWNTAKVPGGQKLGTAYSSVAVADGRLFTMGDLKSDTHVFCLDAETGKALWAVKIGRGGGDGPRCTPTVDGDRVYALSRHGLLACLSAKNGDVIWQVDYKKDLEGRMMSGWDYSESPLVDGELLIGTPGGEKSALAAFNKHDGKLIWKTEMARTGGAGYASPVIAEVGGIRQYITLLGRCLVSVAAKDGRFLWRYDRIANGTANIPTAIVKGDQVFTSTGYGTGAALLKIVPDGNGGCKAEEVYFLNGNKLQNHHGGMILLGKYIYGGHGHNNGLPFCLELESGKLVWGPERGAGSGSAAVVYADGNFYFRYQNGTIALVEATPAGYHLRGSFMQHERTGRQAWPHPVVVHGRMYIRDGDNLLCYDVRQR